MNSARASRVLVPCAEGQAGKLSRLLRVQGATPVELPFSRTLPPTDMEALRTATQHVDAFDLAVFSSPRAVARFLSGVPDPTVLRALQVAAVGSETAEALVHRGVPVSIIPSVFTGEGLLKALLANTSNAAPRRALIVRAQEGRDVVSVGLRAAGWHVETVAAYRTEYTPAEIRAPLRRLLEQRELDAILLTASGVVRALVQAIGEKDLGLLRGVDLVSIGPVTTDAARNLGMTVQASASTSTFNGLVEAWVSLETQTLHAAGEKPEAF